MQEESREVDVVNLYPTLLLKVSFQTVVSVVFAISVRIRLAPVLISCPDGQTNGVLSYVRTTFVLLFLSFPIHAD